MKMKQKRPYVRAALPSGKAPPPVKLSTTHAPNTEEATDAQVEGAAAPKEPSRTQRTMPFSVWEETCTELCISSHTLCEGLGYARGSFNHWAKAGTIPYVAGIACRTLVAEQRLLSQLDTAKKTNPVLLSLRYTKPEHRGMVESFLSAIGVTFDCIPL